MIVEKLFRHRERRASLPTMRIPDWGSYFGDLVNLNFNIPQVPDQLFLVRPEYLNIPRSEDKYDYYEMMSDCSSVDYIVEEEDSPVDIPDDFNESLIQSKDNLIEISIETNIQ